MKNTTLPTEKEILFEFFGDEPVLVMDLPDYANYKAGDLCVCVTRKPTKFLVSVEIHEVFNKTKDCPIHFLVEKPLSRRTKNRIFQAIRHLKSNKKMAGQYWGRMAGYDDLSNENFYKLL